MRSLNNQVQRMKLDVTTLAPVHGRTGGLERIRGSLELAGESQLRVEEARRGPGADHWIARMVGRVD